MVPSKARLFFLVLAALALAAFLGSRGLNEPDEGRYAELAREMAQPGGDWLVPHLNGFEHFQKPPLLYWATAASLRVLGVNEWAARLPSALAALGTVALTIWIGTTLFGEITGLLAGVILLSCGEFFLLAHLLTPDMLMTFWITAALAFLVRYDHGGGRIWSWLFFGAMGLGFMTKGPMALVVPISAALAWQSARRRAGQPRRLPWLSGVLLALALGLGWFVVLSMHEARLFDYFWKYELVERFASHAHGRSKPFWFFIPILLVGVLPWTFLLPALCRRAWQAVRTKTADVPAWLLLGWTVPPFLILSLSGSKLPTYILPLLPALALGLARLRPNVRWAFPLAGGMVALYVAAMGAAPYFNDRFGQQCSVRPLAELVRQRPDFATADVFSSGVRAHGFEFRLQRLISATRDESDIVLPLTPAQHERVIELSHDGEEQMLVNLAPGAVAYGLVRSEGFTKNFTMENWTVLGRAGDFLLIASRPEPLASGAAAR